MKKTIFFCFTIVCLFFTNNINAQLYAFPGAEGFGRISKGGRGGMVATVTNLNDTGTGSLRWAIAQHPGKPLTVVFAVSGIIELKSAIKMSRSFITIAGQTAPGDGICIKGHSFIMNGASVPGLASDIILRYIRFRPGAFISSGIYGLDMENCRNVIIDHCSFSWANEENAALYDAKNVTVQWCISSEGLYSANHMKGVRGYNGVWGGQYASFHHNLIAHCASRTIRYNGARAHDTIALVDSRNNVIYNSRQMGSCYGGEVEIPGGESKINIVNSYYKNGPVTPSSWKFVNASTGSPSTGVGLWYLAGNIMTGNASFTANNKAGIDGGVPAYAKSDTAFAIPAWAQITMQNADSAYNMVLEGAGAILPKRDSVDKRIVNETLLGIATGTGVVGNGIIDSPSTVGGWPVYNSLPAPADTDHDGMPDYWEASMGLNPADSADRNLYSATGYTHLEDYLNGITGSLAVQQLNGTARQKISVYPNPVGTVLNIMHPMTNNEENIAIYNLTGSRQLMLKTLRGVEQTAIDITILPAGMYYAVFNNSLSTASVAFIKK